jgi:arylsulfatase
MKQRLRFAALLFPLLFCLPLATVANAADTRPNILVIVADDLGFSDIGAFGGEIATPNLDQIAQRGLRFAQFHTAAACSPTRAMLMTGTDHHVAGIANMSELMTPDQRGKPGYEGALNERVVTIAELLRDSGYATLMSGKWHLGIQPQQNPAQRGFERSFALLQAGHNHFGKPDLPPPELGGVAYTENGSPVQLPKDFYSSDFFTDKLIDYLRADAAGNKPFFAYLPFTAPHWPLQAPPASIAKYKGRYDGGWEVLRRERIARQRELGLLPANSETSAPSTMGDWNALSAEEKQRHARAMEIYAAMVDRLDWNVGRVLDYLRESGKLDNTVIVFFSDNGAEGANAGQILHKLMGGNLPVPTLEQMGSVDSLMSYGPNWAQAAMAPRRLFKAVSTEGGISSPAIIRFPGFARQQQTTSSFATAMDIMPTLLELAGVQYPDKTWHDKPIVAMRGTSMLPFLMNRSSAVHKESEAVGWELFGQRALRQGPWKITFVSVPNGSGRWELYNLTKDPGERHDVSAQFPETAKKLMAQWNAYSGDMGIILHEQVVSPYTDQ